MYHESRARFTLEQGDYIQTCELNEAVRSRLDSADVEKVSSRSLATTRVTVGCFIKSHGSTPTHTPEFRPPDPYPSYYRKTREILIQQQLVCFNSIIFTMSKAKEAEGMFM